MLPIGRRCGTRTASPTNTMIRTRGLARSVMYSSSTRMERPKAARSPNCSRRCCRLWRGGRRHDRNSSGQDLKIVDGADLDERVAPVLEAHLQALVSDRYEPYGPERRAPDRDDLRLW